MAEALKVGQGMPGKPVVVASLVLVGMLIYLCGSSVVGHSSMCQHPLILILLVCCVCLPRQVLTLWMRPQA